MTVIAPETRPAQLEHAVAGSELQARRREGERGIMELEATPAVRYGAYLWTLSRVFVPGCFAESLQQRESDGRTLPMGWEHHVFSAFTQVGRWERWEERKNGLFLSEGIISDTRDGRDCATLIEDKALDAASIGHLPRVIQFAEPKERVQFDTPFGKQTYTFDAWVMYVIESDLVETSIVHAGADEGARTREVQALMERAATRLPGLAAGAGQEDVTYSMAALMGGARLDLPDTEHRALYGELATRYAKHGLTPPAYEQRPAYENVSFQHGEREVFADRQLRDHLAAVAGTDVAQLSADTRAQAESAAGVIARLLYDPDVEKLAEIDGTLRQTLATLKSTRKDSGT